MENTMKAYLVASKLGIKIEPNASTHAVTLIGSRRVLVAFFAALGLVAEVHERIAVIATVALDKNMSAEQIGGIMIKHWTHY